MHKKNVVFWIQGVFLFFFLGLCIINNSSHSMTFLFTLSIKALNPNVGKVINIFLSIFYVLIKNILITKLKGVWNGAGKLYRFLVFDWYEFKTRKDCYQWYGPIKQYSCIAVCPNPQVLFGSCYQFPCVSAGKESSCNEGDLGLIAGLGRFPAEGNGNPLQYSCLENPMDRGA